MPHHAEKREVWARERIAASERPAKPLDRAVLAFLRRLAPEGECLLWTGFLTKDGYGVARFGGREQRAHRIAYQLTVGPIPEGMQIDHLCHNRACVNPDHLEAVTPRVNWERADGNAAHLNAQKTHCIRGHEFTPENIYEQPSKPGSRVCRTCLSTKRAEWFARNPEKARESQRRAHKKWAQANREHINAKQRERRATNPEMRERRNAERRKRGTRKYVLDDEQVAEIRELHARGIAAAEISRRLDVSYTTTGRVIHREGAYA